MTTYKTFASILLFALLALSQISETDAVTSVQLSTTVTALAKKKRSPPPPPPKRRRKRRPPPPPLKTKKSPPPPKKSSTAKRPPPPARPPPVQVYSVPPPKLPSISPPPPPPKKSPPPPPPPSAKLLPLSTYSIVSEYPHDPSAFTEGLQYEERCSGGSCKQIFYESTGIYGESSLREVDLQTGNVLRKHMLPFADFGEGVTKFNNKLFQLTWLSGKTFSYNVDNFDDVQVLSAPLNDGWGITNDGTNLIASNSTDTLSFINPSTMQLVKGLKVTYQGKSVPWLNELEYIDGLIYANVLTTECIAKIDPGTGNVVGWLIMNGLKQSMMNTLSASAKSKLESPDAVLNGIAWDQKGSRLFLTGKWWPKMYQVQEVPVNDGNKAAVEENVKDCIVNPFTLGRRRK